MSESARKSIVASFAASLLGLGLLILLLSVGAGPLRADAPLYVDDDACPNVGTGTTGDPFCTIQSAVDAAPDFGEVRVAAGTYTGTHALTAKNGNIYTQVVLIDRKNITVTGGFDASDWPAGPDPTANPTIVDAQRFGRGFTVLGTRSQMVTLDGVTVTGGDYTWSGNIGSQVGRVCTGTGYDCGGGLRAERVQLILRDMLVYDNIAGTDPGRASQGGGMDATELQPGSLIENSRFISNTAGGDRGYGGGIFWISSDVVIRESLFKDNYAARSGGGLYMHFGGPARLEGTSFEDNTAESSGGGLYSDHGYCGDSGKEYLVMDRGYLTGNQAWDGAALTIGNTRSRFGDCGATLSNLILAKNKTDGATTDQAVINVYNFMKVFPLDINHVTAAENEATTFLHLYAGEESGAFTATIKNTLVFSSAIGIAGDEVSGSLKIVVDHPLLDKVTDEYNVAGGDPEFVLLDQVAGDPRLDANYHLTWGSAAINAGIDAGIYHDIDGDLRPASLPDIGADEIGNPIFVPFVTK